MPRVYTTLLKVTRIRLRIIAIDCASFTSVCVAVAEAILWRQHGSERIDPWRRGDDGSADPGGQPLTNTLQCCRWRVSVHERRSCCLGSLNFRPRFAKPARRNCALFGRRPAGG